jgi:mitogen-activated protein kinase 15
MYLQELARHDNIVKLLNVIKADNDRDIYLVFEYMDTDLHACIRANILEDIHKQYIMYQLLKAIKYMHSAGILHRDLKPSNLLLNKECLVKVADFGLARSIAALQQGGGGPSPVLTDYVATRWYRAPEILLGSTAYSKGVDMWTVGCILGELIHGKPIFPGASTMDQLNKIIRFTGYPKKEAIEAMKSPFAATMLESIPPSRGTPLHELFPSAPHDALDLMSRLLQFNPADRLTAEEAIRHPYVAAFHSEADEPVCEKPIKISVDDDVKFTVSDYRDHLYAEIVKKKREIRKRVKGAPPPSTSSASSVPQASRK